MTKFMQGKGPRLVWNPETNKVSVTFISGEFQTNDKASIALLLKAGYTAVPSLKEDKTNTNVVLKRTKKESSHE